MQLLRRIAASGAFAALATAATGVGAQAATAPHHPARLTHRPAARVVLHPHEVGGVVAPGDAYLVTADPAAGTLTWRDTTRGISGAVAGLPGAAQPRASADGLHVVFTYGGVYGTANAAIQGVAVWTPSTGVVSQLTQETTAGTYGGDTDVSPAISPDGTTVAYDRTTSGTLSGYGLLLTVPIVGGTPTPTATRVQPGSPVAYARDGSVLYQPQFGDGRVSYDPGCLVADVGRGCLLSAAQLETAAAPSWQARYGGQPGYYGSTYGFVGLSGLGDQAADGGIPLVVFGAPVQPYQQPDDVVAGILRPGPAGSTPGGQAVAVSAVYGTAGRPASGDSSPALTTSGRTFLYEGGDAAGTSAVLAGVEVATGVQTVLGAGGSGGAAYYLPRD